MPIVSLLLSHILSYSHILSFLSYSNARFLFPCRTAVFLPPSYAAPPRSNRRTESYSSFRDRDASVVVLEQGAAMLSNPGRRARRFWQADFCASNASRITMALSYLNLVDVIGYMKVAVLAHVHANSPRWAERKIRINFIWWTVPPIFIFFQSPLYVSHFLSKDQLILYRSHMYISEKYVTQYVAFISIWRNKA